MKDETEKKGCLHLSWTGKDGMMVCRQCGAQRLPYAWENAYGDTRDVDQLRIRHDGRDGDV